MLEVGKLYTCEEYRLMLYPDLETVAGERDAAAAARAGGASVAYWSNRLGKPVSYVAYWSNRLGKPVSYAEKNTPILALNNKEEYVEVLAGDKKGWIIFKDWLKIKEIDNV